MEDSDTSEWFLEGAHGFDTGLKNPYELGTKEYLAWYFGYQYRAQSQKKGKVTVTDARWPGD